MDHRLEKIVRPFLPLVERISTKNSQVSALPIQSFSPPSPPVVAAPAAPLAALRLKKISESLLSLSTLEPMQKTNPQKFSQEIREVYAIFDALEPAVQQSLGLRC